MNIDALLSQPLAPVADNGFSARVIARVRRQELRRAVLWGLAVTVFAVLACALLPVPALAMALNLMALRLAASAQVWLAIAALVLVFLYERRFFRL